MFISLPPLVSKSNKDYYVLIDSVRKITSIFHTLSASKLCESWKQLASKVLCLT